MNKYFYRLKHEYHGNEYPWPCGPHPDRVYELFDNDIFTKSKDGTYSKHTGLGTFGHVIPDDHLDAYEGWPAMSMNGLPYGKYEKPRKISVQRTQT